MDIVVTGATGFIGRPLCAELVGAGHRVTALARDADRARALLGSNVMVAAWPGADNGWRQVVIKADAVIHLAGESVAGQRWTPEFKAKIRSSRIEPTRALVDALQQAPRPAALISASAVGYYGDRGDEVVTEASSPGTGFLPEVCVAWEAEALKAREAGARVALMRTGIVLGKGGALDKMLHPLPLPINPWKLGLGGPIGSGKQWLPWIHLDDVVALYLWAATTPQLAGPCNVTAPNPVTSAEFARAIGRALHRPAALPVPALALKLGLGEFADSLLTGQKVIPTVPQRLGYRFRFPDLDAALASLLRT